MSCIVLSQREWLDEKMRPCWESITLTTEANGAMRLQITLMGEGVEEDLGDFDLEDWFDIPPQLGCQGLAASLSRLCAQNPGISIEGLEAHLDQAGLTYTTHSWI